MYRPVPEADHQDAAGEQHDAHPQRLVRELLHGVDAQEQVDERPDQQGVREGADLRAHVELARDDEDHERDRDVRGAEREPCVVRDSLVEHIPR